MSYCRVSLTLILGVVLCWGALAASEPLEGFWQKDGRWQRRASVQRKIYVSARTDQHEELMRLRVQAMGLVAAPLSFTVKKSKQYSELPQVSGHFKAAEFRDETQQLFLVTEALRWQARMLMQLTYRTEESGRQYHEFEVIDGSFQGLKGEIIFTEFEVDRTQLVVHASYSGKSLPLPKILMGMALEVIVQQVAQRIRGHLEKSFQDLQRVPVLAEENLSQ